MCTENMYCTNGRAIDLLLFSLHLSHDRFVRREMNGRGTLGMALPPPLSLLVSLTFCFFRASCLCALSLGVTSILCVTKKKVKNKTKLKEKG